MGSDRPCQYGLVSVGNISSKYSFFVHILKRRLIRTAHCLSVGIMEQEGLRSACLYGIACGNPGLQASAQAGYVLEAGLLQDGSPAQTAMSGQANDDDVFIFR